MATKLVKLQIYQHQADETIIETFEAETWDDFVLVKVKFDEGDEVHGIQEVFVRYAEEHPDKQVILFQDTIDLEFYGIREVEDD